VTAALGYVRVSTEEQHLGPDAQRDAIARACAARGLSLVAVHEDRGVSGAAPLEDRPGLLAALGALEVHRGAVLVVARRDRIARDVMLAAMVERLVERAKGRVLSAAGEGTDGDGLDPSALLMRRIVDAFAEYERALIRCRTRAALDQLRKQGVRLGGEALGWRRGERPAEGARRPIEDIAEEQATIALIVGLHRVGRSLRGIRDELEGIGVRTKRGGRWSPSTIRAVLRRAGEVPGPDRGTLVPRSELPTQAAK
jgi:DNA invertase Pin-like site-specific DNA recombinase